MFAPHNASISVAGVATVCIGSRAPVYAEKSLFYFALGTPRVEFESGGVSGGNGRVHLPTSTCSYYT